MQLWASGARNQIVMLAGGWELPSVARHYTRLVCEDWSSKPWWPAWLQKELREPAAEARTDGDVLGPAGHAARKRRRTPSAGPPGAE